MITFPAWYQGGFPDTELLVLDLVQRFLDELDPPGRAVSHLPSDYAATVESGIPLVRVYRGGMAGRGLFDPAAVQLGVIAASRADSWAVMEYLRQVLLSFDHGGSVKREDGSVSTIESVSEVVGPQQLPELNPDLRLVPATFRVECRRPRSLPDYAQVRAGLPL